MLGHAPRVGQARQVVAVDLRPTALRAARGEALQEGLLVVQLVNCVDPAPAQRDVERLRVRHRRRARVLLIDAQKDFARAIVILGQPLFERGRVGEGTDGLGVPDDRRHSLRASRIEALVDPGQWIAVQHRGSNATRTRSILPSRTWYHSAMSSRH